MSDFENDLPDPRQSKFGASKDSKPLAEEQIFLDYFDGNSAIPRRVELRIEGTFLSLIPAEGPPVRWHLADLRRVPDQAGGKDASGIVLALKDGSAQRLYIPADHENLANALSMKTPVQSAQPTVPGIRYKLLGLSTAAIASVAFILFVLVPVMADQLAEFLPAEGEQALGDVTFEQIRTALNQDAGGSVQICERAAGQAALENMTARLSKHASFPFPLKVHVLQHEMINAFALPGGHIILFEGLIKSADTAEEVAAVLAHEMGHVASRDATRGALRSAGLIGVLGLVFGDFAGGTLALFLANQLIEAQYSQSVEVKADDYAARLLADAGLPPEALGVFFRRLRDDFGDEEGLVAHFSSHPALRDRMQAAAEAGRRNESNPTSSVLTVAEWADLRRICG